MDTIIYLYHGKEEERFVAEKWQQREYCLIRLGIPALLWQNLKKLELAAEEAEKFSGRQQEKQKWIKGLKTQVAPLLLELARWQVAVSFLGDNPDWTYCVYEEYLLEKIDVGMWWGIWRLPRFREYHAYVYVEELMKHATQEAYLVLGYAPCVPRIMREYATRMKRIEWILKPEQCTEAVWKFVEAFYEEYGLVIVIKQLEENESWIRVQPTSLCPVNVLDFTEEEKLSTYRIARGSVWLDMDSLEGKERRMEARCPQIGYFSLKKQWKQLQKDCGDLDTVGQNRYNT